VFFFGVSSLGFFDDFFFVGVFFCFLFFVSDDFFLDGVVTFVFFSFAFLDVADDERVRFFVVSASGTVWLRLLLRGERRFLSDFVLSISDLSFVFFSFSFASSLTNTILMAVPASLGTAPFFSASTGSAFLLSSPPRNQWHR
jgi:hypothetical protein